MTYEGLRLKINAYYRKWFAKVRHVTAQKSCEKSAPNWIVNSKSDRFYKVRDLLNSAGDKYPSVPCKRMLLKIAYN